MANLGWPGKGQIDISADTELIFVKLQKNIYKGSWYLSAEWRMRRSASMSRSRAKLPQFSRHFDGTNPEEGSGFNPLGGIYAVSQQSYKAGLSPCSNYSFQENVFKVVKIIKDWNIKYLIRITMDCLYFM